MRHAAVGCTCSDWLRVERERLIFSCRAHPAIPHEPTNVTSVAVRSTITGHLIPHSMSTFSRRPGKGVTSTMYNFVAEVTIEVTKV